MFRVAQREFAAPEGPARHAYHFGTVTGYLLPVTIPDFPIFVKRELTENKENLNNSNSRVLNRDARPRFEVL